MQNLTRSLRRNGAETSGGLHAARARRGRASITEQTATHKYTSIYIHSTIPRRVGLESSCTVSHEGDILTTEMCCTALLSFVHTVGKHVCFTSSLSDKLSSSRPLENFGQLELSGREREREIVRGEGVFPGNFHLGDLFC